MPDEPQHTPQAQLELLEKTFDQAVEVSTVQARAGNVASMAQAEKQLEALKALRVRFLGKKSELASLKKMIGRVPAESRSA
ncbi:MAG: hypothetical protein ACXWID_08555, partial [Pyrinomonadaceae bacterium]